MTSESGADRLPVENNERIDEICLRYEDCWIQGDRPVLESYLNRAEIEDRPALVYELLRIDLAYGNARRELLTEEAYARQLPSYRDAVRSAFRIRPPNSAIQPYHEGDRVGRFRVVRELGRGGFGAVFLARDEPLGRDVAIKTIRPDLVATPQARQQLHDEARLAATLDHAGVASVYEVGEDDHGRPFLVCQYVPGESLRAKMRREKIAPSELAAIVRQLATAVDYAHRAGVVHRDLQPSNVLLDESGRPIVTDFGLATHRWLRPAEPGEVAGSPSYLAPEQARGDARQTDARVDVWALGVILYEGLTGARPFHGESPEEVLRAVLEVSPTPPRQIDNTIPAALEAICLRCLQKTPHDRYSTAADLGKDLHDVLEPNRRRRRRFILGAGALAAVAFCFIAWAGLTRGWPPDKEKRSRRVDSRLLTLRDGFWSEVGSQRSPSVGNGDAIRFEATTDEPGFFYVVWIDGDGTAAPVAPWRDGDWLKRNKERPANSLMIPPGVDAYWEMSVKRHSTETVMVLLRDTPLPADFDLAALFDDLPAQPPITGSGIARFQNGQVTLVDDRRRLPKFETVGSAKHGVLVSQQLLYQRLQQHFANIHAHCFSAHP